MFKLGDNYRIIRKVRNSIFDEVYQISSITKITVESLDRPSEPTVYGISFRMEENGLTLDLYGECRDCDSEYSDCNWYDHVALDDVRLDWKVIKQ